MPRPPYTFHDFVGHQHEVRLLRRHIQGAKARAEPFPHSLLTGPSGVGKTVLAEAVGAEFGTTVVEVQGCDSVASLTSKLTQLNHGDFLFIDEAHNLTPEAQEALFSVIDNLKVPAGKAKGTTLENEKPNDYLPVNPCTIILATDRPGDFLDALHKRFAITINLWYYGIAEMKQIVDRLASKLGLLISPQASKRIARVSGGLPRNARFHLENLRRHFPESGNSQIGLLEIRQFLREFGITKSGLNPIARKYLRRLSKLGKASLESMALFLGCDAKYVKKQIEPQLDRKRLITIRPGGRMISDRGRKMIERLNTNRTQK